MNMNTKATKTGATLALALSSVTLGGLALAPAANAQVANSTFTSYTSPAGTTSQYHVYADGIDWSKPVGAVFYFDGDYWTQDQSKIYNPQNSDLTAMAQVAAQHNMIFVPIISPDTNASGDGITWWEDQAKNGEYARALMEHLESSAGLDRSNIWTVGYSGGAELETFELNANHQTDWRTGGGSVMIGGGGSNGMMTAPGANANVAMDWFAGANDVVGATNPPTWSALSAAQQGKGEYDAAGFTNTNLTIIPNTNHMQYNFANILSTALGAVATTPAATAPTPAPAPAVTTAAPATDPANVPADTATPAATQQATGTTKVAPTQKNTEAATPAAAPVDTNVAVADATITTSVSAPASVSAPVPPAPTTTPASVATTSPAAEATGRSILVETAESTNASSESPTAQGMSGTQKGLVVVGILAVVAIAALAVKRRLAK